MTNQEQLAEAMYEAYCEAVGGVSFRGEPLPKWKEFSADPATAKQSKAWIVAAETALIFCEDLNS